MEDIIKIIIASFSSLWKVKKYGKTIEIITPFFTTNDCFVSVFLTEREAITLLLMVVGLVKITIIIFSIVMMSLI